MSIYQGISRVYRPQTFAAILGQSPIVTTLKNALKQKKTAQAYLFCGTRGTGKTTLARVLAKALNCSHISEDGEPCNTCSSCLEITQGRNLNVLEIDGASNRGIDDIRKLSESVAYAPATQGCKVFIIDEAHMLTKEAFNALLKTLEEPPPNVKFFLATTESHKIPLTIVSRCQKFDLQRIPAELLTQKLSDILHELNVSYEEEALYALTSLADGSMRVAESLLDQVLCFSKELITEKTIASCLGTLPFESFLALDLAFKGENLPFAFTFAHEIFSSGKDLIHFFDSLLDHYRMLFSIKSKVCLEKIPSTLQEKYTLSASYYTEEQLLYILDYLIEWHDRVHKSPFKRVTLEMILLHILRSKHRVSASDLILRLEQLQEEPSLALIKQEAPPPEKPPAQPQAIELPPVTQQPPQEIKPPVSPTYYDTFTRFATVELEGTLSVE
jgi:DNA polymerase-3 subunit gamma/tau